MGVGRPGRTARRGRRRQGRVNAPARERATPADIISHAAPADNISHTAPADNVSHSIRRHH